jgi:Predicted pPIWI-associating nuclease
MSALGRELKKAILEVLNAQAQANKFNLIGRGAFQKGALEDHLKRELDADERARAAQAFEELRRDGYLQATYQDLADPENWVTITSSGKEFLSRDLKDNIDLALERISPHLVELRQGMWDAIDRTSPDAPRQAAHSARELLDQLLKEGTPAECKTRKERLGFLMQKNRGDQAISKTDQKIALTAIVDQAHNSN